MFNFRLQSNTSTLAQINYQGTNFTTIGDLISKVLPTIYSIAGVIFVAMVIYGGFKWMTAADDANKVGSAKKTIISAIIGLIIVLLAFVIDNYVRSLFK